MKKSSSEEVVVEKIKKLLPEFNQDKKVAIMRKFIRAPGFDYRVLYKMLIKESKKKKKKSVVLDHQENIVGVKITQKPTVLRFKVSPIPPVPTLSAIENNNAIKNQIPITENSMKIGPTLSKTDLGDEQGNTNSDVMPKRKGDTNVLSDSGNNNVITKNQKPVITNPVNAGLKRQKTDGDDDFDHDDDEEEDKFRPKKKKKPNDMPKTKVVSAFGSDSANTPDMPQKLEEIMNRVNGSDPVFVMQKRLFPSDVNRGLARLSLPLSQLNPRFLTEEEKNKLSEHETIETEIFEPCGEQCVITLTKWKMGRSPIYNLIKTWNDIVRRNDLEDGTLVQLWSFRVGEELRLFLAKL